MSVMFWVGFAFGVVACFVGLVLYAVLDSRRSAKVITPRRAELFRMMRVDLDEAARLARECGFDQVAERIALLRAARIELVVTSDELARGFEAQIESVCNEVLAESETAKRMCSALTSAAVRAGTIALTHVYASAEERVS